MNTLRKRRDNTSSSTGSVASDEKVNESETKEAEDVKDETTNYVAFYSETIKLVVVNIILKILGFIGVIDLSNEKCLTLAQSWDIWREILLIISPNWLYFISSVLINLLKSSIEIFQPYLLGLCIDVTTQVSQNKFQEIVTNDNEMEIPVSSTDSSEPLYNQLFWYSIGIAFCHILSGLTHAIKVYLVHIMKNEAICQLQEHTFRRALLLDLTYYDNTHSSDMNQAINSLNGVEFVVGNLVPNIVSTVFTTISVSIYLIRSPTGQTDLVLPMMGELLGGSLG